MTDSEHVYTATVAGEVVPIRDGSVKLDVGSAPHVSGSVTIPYTPELAALIDVRTSPPPRLLITADATFPTMTQHRAFDLTVRSRPVRQRGAEMTVAVASDEALLSDYAPLVDDPGGFAYQASLRAVVDYVLAKAIPGAALEASPANDADVTTYSDATNLAPDPRVMSLASYGSAGVTRAQDGVYPGAQDSVSHYGLNLHTPTSSDGFGNVGGDSGAMRAGMQAGKTYVISAAGSVRTTLSGTAHARARRIVVFHNNGGAGTVEVASSAIPATVNASTRVSVEVTLPPGTTDAFIRLYHGHTGGTVTWSRLRVSEKDARPGADNTSYFWGGKPDTAAYDYAWSGPADASPSARRALIDRSVDVLLWKAGQSAIDFLHPLVQAFGYRLVCDELRRWTLRSEAYTAPGALSIRHGVNLIDGDDTISRDAGTWFDAAITVHTWIDEQGISQTRTDAFALTTPYTKLRRFDKTTPYPGPGFSEYAVRRAQGRGREVTATTVADWAATAEQPITIILDGAPIQTGAVQAVEFDLTRDRMTVTTRTTDTPAGAIDLLVGTINALPGPINAL